MSTEKLLKDGLAHELTRYAAGLLQLGQQLNGNVPAMHNNAVFQSADIILAELFSTVDKYRTAFKPYEVHQTTQSISVSRELQQRFATHAAKAGSTISEHMEAALTDYLRNNS